MNRDAICRQSKGCSVRVFAITFKISPVLFLAFVAASALYSHAPSQLPAVNAAASFTVNSTDDAVDDSPGDGACSTSASQCTLRAAIMETNALIGPDTITLPSAIYTLTIPNAGPYEPASGDLDVWEDLTIRGDGAATTIIQACNSGVGPCTGIDRVFHLSGGTIEISGVTVRNGSTSGDYPGGRGGGIFVSAYTAVQLVDVHVTDSAADNGGGIYQMGAGGTLTLTNVTISRNTATRFGGGIWSASVLRVDRSIFSGNHGLWGGGIRVDGGELEITNSTFSGNTADEFGGGVFVNDTTTIQSSTLADNVAPSGASLFVGGTTAVATLRNTVITSNGVDCGTTSSTIASAGHNVSSDTSCNLAGTGDLSATDPLLGPLADNGGPTYTHALLEGSPAIDAGDNANCPTVDQRGASRPQGAGCDIGAFEIGELTTPSPTPAPIQTNLAQDAPAGTTVLQTTDLSGFAARDLIVIDPGGPNEEYSVVNGLGSLELAAPLQLAHLTGESIARLGTDIPPGDGDCSRTLDTNDLLSILRRVAGVGPFDQCVSAGNIYCNDIIDARDALAFLLYLTGMPPDVGDCPIVQL